MSSGPQTPITDTLNGAESPLAPRNQYCSQPHWRVHRTSRYVPVEQNRLLAALPEDEYERLLPHLDSVRLPVNKTLAARNEPIQHVYFLRDAVVAMVVPMEDGRTIECATVGNEGMVGLEVFLGDGTAAEDVLIQIPGSAGRVSVAAFKELVLRSAPLQKFLQNYTLALINQLARTAGCNRVHRVEQRCARWLLMSHDRVGENIFPLTHEALAGLLGVRRASVTEAAKMLQRGGLIRYRRGRITILDRDRLEAASCEDYRECRETYNRILERHWG